jgi:hypothetical protein
MAELDGDEDGPPTGDPVCGIAYCRSVGAATSVATGGSAISPFCRGK